jgi:hypothetical protein
MRHYGGRKQSRWPQPRPAALLSELFFGGLSGALRFLLINNILPVKVRTNCHH